MEIIKTTYQIWKNGRYTERDVSVFWEKGSKRGPEILNRLHDDFPTSEGYYLKYQGTQIQND